MVKIRLRTVKGDAESIHNSLTESPNQCIFNVYTWRFILVTKIQKWGNSLGLRIPKSLANEAGVEEGSAVDIFLEEDRLVIRPLRTARYRLSDMLSKVCEDNLHEEISTGDAVGREVW
jgi:antitoxin MazE